MFEKRAKKRLTFTILLGLVCVMLFIACTCIISDTAPQTANAATTLTQDEIEASVALHGDHIGGDGTHTGNIRELPSDPTKMGGGTYYLKNDTVLSGTITLPGSAIVDLCLNGHKLTNSTNGPIFRVYNGTSLAIYDCQGKGCMIGNGDVCVVVSGKNEEKARNSSFTMRGGVICDSNRNVASKNGGGVRIEKDGDFTMRGGVIKNNLSLYGGGVYVAGTMVMNGGIITDNSAYGSATDGVVGQGCGIMCASGGSLTINGGIIRNNTTVFGDGGGISCANGSDVAVKGGVIEKNSVVPGGTNGNGGGIFCNSGSNVSLTGGTISRNDTGGSGGGVFLNGSTLKIGRNVIISDNSSRKLGKNNLHLYLSAKIDFVSQILSGFDVGVSVQKTGIITSGYKAVGKLDPYSDLRLKIDSPNYVLKPASNGNEITAVLANSWVTPLAMSDFVYGSKSEGPSASAEHGKVEFSYSDSENGNFVSDMPTNAGIHWVKATVPADDYRLELSAVVSFEIKPIVLTEEMVGHIGGLFMYNGSRHTPPVLVIDKLLTNKDFAVTYGENIDAGEGTVTVTGKNNYSGTITRYFTIDPVTMTASVMGYMGTYDKTAHDAAAEQTAVTVNDQTATWTYSTDNDIYSETMPQFENAGTYTVYYKVNAPNHIEYSGTFTVEISKATVSVPTIGDKVYTGEVQTADVPVSELYEVTQNDGGTNVGQYDLILTLADHANYKWAESTEISGDNSEIATLKFSLDPATMTANVKGYSGTYDKTAKDAVAAQTAITVNNQTATWTYSETSDGTYTVTMSQYINAGTYTVYYKVNAPNHNEYSGSFTVEIEQATVVAPAIAEKTYNGELQTADVAETEEYAVTINDGGTSAGEYDVILTLKDYANYKWLQGVEISGENAETATLKFTIAQAANDWTEAPQAGSVIYGVDVTATAQSAFGNVQITYVDEAGEILELDPKLAGKYKAVFTVEGTADYMGLREEVSFTIGQREITITIHDKTSVYGEETVPLTFELTEGEYVDDSDSEYIELRKEAGGDAKTYAITGECTNANYKVKFVNGTYKITKATYVTDDWKFDGKTVTYNGETHSLAVTGLPAGLTVTYLSNDKTNVGTYEVTAKFNVDGNHNAVEDMTATLTIEKATYVTDNWKFDGKTVTYNGETHSLGVTGLPAGLTVTYVNNDKTNVGTYVVTAKFEVDENYNAVEDMTATLTIEKATYITNDWTFDGKTVTYNGGTHSLAVTGLPAGVQVSYINNGKTNAGTYEVTAKFSVDENHNAVEDMTATLTINKADHDMSGVTFEGKTVTYNGQTHSLAVTGLPEGVEVTYVNNNKTNAGTYTVTAKFVASANYNELADMTATLTVKKAVYNMSGVKLEDKTIEADGNAQSITISGTLPNGVTVTYEGNGQTDAGEYTVTAKFSGDAANYEPIPDKTAKLTITQAPEKGGCGGVVLDGGMIAGITLAVLAFAIVFAMRKAKGGK